VQNQLMSSDDSPVSLVRLSVDNPLITEIHATL